MNLFQIAAGSSGRNYSDLFLHHDLMLIGPGELGPFPQNESKYKSRYKGNSKNQIAWFTERPSSGDIVLLRSGNEVLAAGRIPVGGVDGYRYYTPFDDILGWDLNHGRRVIWSEDAKSVFSDPTSVFSDRRDSRFSGVGQPLTQKLSALDDAIDDRPLKVLPDAAQEAGAREYEALSLEELGRELFAAGLANDAVERVIKAVERIRRLYSWYRRTGSDRPSEMEVISHMFIPLLTGLGWSEQLLAVESCVNYPV